MATTTIRKDASRLTPQEKATLRDAYSKMMGIGDSRGWIAWCGVHGFPEFKCWHHNREGFNSPVPYNLFLPWHRAYLLSFEHAARDQNNAAALPWWDWTSRESHTIGLPVPFTEAVPGGNVLTSGPVPPMDGDPARMTERFPGNPASLPTAARIDQILRLTSFEDFTIQIENIHDRIHGWVGGDMGVVAQSAFDPIFWSHHCMIDRLWYMWQLRHGVSNIPQSYVNRPLEPFGLRVSDVLDLANLGYMYATAAVSVRVVR